VTLSICGLGFVDETEIEGVKGAHFISAEVAESENFVPPVEVEYDAQPAEEKLKKLEEKVTKITPNPVETKKPEGQPSKQQLNYLLSQAKEKMQWETHQITLYLQRKYGLQSSVGLSMDQYAELFKIVTTTNYALAIAELDRKDKESLKNG
jgi:hypothetical protein